MTEKQAEAYDEVLRLVTNDGNKLGRIMLYAKVIAIDELEEGDPFPVRVWWISADGATTWNQADERHGRILRSYPWR